MKKFLKPINLKDYTGISIVYLLLRLSVIFVIVDQILERRL